MHKKEETHSKEVLSSISLSHVFCTFFLLYWGVSLAEDKYHLPEYLCLHLEASPSSSNIMSHSRRFKTHMMNLKVIAFVFSDPLSCI